MGNHNKQSKPMRTTSFTFSGLRESQLCISHYCLLILPQTGRHILPHRRSQRPHTSLYDHCPFPLMTPFSSAPEPSSSRLRPLGRLPLLYVSLRASPFPPTGSPHSRRPPHDFLSLLPVYFFGHTYENTYVVILLIRISLSLVTTIVPKPKSPLSYLILVPPQLCSAWNVQEIQKCHLASLSHVQQK